MPYDNTLQTDKDKVRHLVGDVYEFEFLSDNEIQFILDESGDIYTAAGEAAMAIAARVARNTDYRFSTLWRDASQAYKHFTDLAKRLFDKAGRSVSFAPLFVHSGDTQTDYPDPVFGVGQFDYETEPE